MTRSTNVIVCFLYLLPVLLVGCSKETSQSQSLSPSQSPTQNIPNYEFIRLWTIEEDIRGLATADLNEDGKDEIITSYFNKIVTYDSSGNTLDTIIVADNNTDIRVADLDGDNHLDIIRFRVWGDNITALNNNGEFLWEFPAGTGVDNVAVCDIDGDDTKEVIVGFNGSTGLYLLEHTGEMRWKNTNIGNVWYVSGGDLNDNGSVEVVSTAADGNIHIFNSVGTELQVINSPIYAFFVAVDEFIGDSFGPEIITSGSEGDDEIISIYDGNGNFLWEDKIGEGDASIFQAACLSQEGLLAIGTRDGQIYVFNSEGETVFYEQGLGPYVLVTWIEDEDGNNILVAGNSDSLTAYQLY